VLIGLPDTVWTPEDGFSQLPDGVLSFLLFPVERPELFDAVVMDVRGRVEEIEVKRLGARTHWIWGGMKMPGRVLRELHAIWTRPERGDEYFGTLVNAWIDEGGEAWGVKAGDAYVDTGTLHGYRAAIRLLSEQNEHVEVGTHG
jgi:glucose-1-phosphate thymidylyltransferase